MKIAFDAKRVYQNETGLGNYSRTLISSLATCYPQHKYYLCAPKVTELFNASSFHNLPTLTPHRFPATALKSIWRSNWVKKDLMAEKTDLYHGLSNEIPRGINKAGIKSVVTIHDLIFERYPKQYNWLDRLIYRNKFKYACKHADKIIAVSKQTKEDLVQLYHVPGEKVDVCYQSCNTAFAVSVTENEKQRVKERYNLPAEYFLYVGAIIERKNLLNVCKALKQLTISSRIPLVVIGDGGNYKQRVKQYIAANHLEAQVIFLSDNPTIKSLKSYNTAVDFPAIYQQALCMIYPSVFEGFGIPVLEAMWSRLPVITSRVSSMPEIAGDGCYYVDPSSVDEIANAMMEVGTSASIRKTMEEKGWKQAQYFTPEKCAAGVMQVYLSCQHQL